MWCVAFGLIYWSCSFSCLNRCTVIPIRVDTRSTVEHSGTTQRSNVEPMLLTMYSSTTSKIPPKLDRNRFLCVQILWWDFVNVSIMLESAHTSHCWCHVVYLNAATTRKLSDQHFEIVNWTTDNKQHYQVWNEKCTSTVFQCNERKSPYVSQSHWHCNAWHQKFPFIWPGITFWWYRIVCELQMRLLAINSHQLSKSRWLIHKPAWCLTLWTRFGAFYGILNRIRADSMPDSIRLPSVPI